MTDSVPYIWKNSDDTDIKHLIKEQFGDVKNILDRQGAILFKDYNVFDQSRLSEFIDSLPGEPLNYIDGNSPRSQLESHVYTSTEHPSDVFISLHSELSYAKTWPSHLFFCCEIAPEKDGNTLIADNREIIKALPADIVEMFQTKGVIYHRNLHGGFGSGPSWQNTFETEDKSVVEKHCQASDTQFRWTDSGSLILSQKRLGTIDHPITGETCWFNQADQFHPSTNPPEVYEALVELYGETPEEFPQNATFGDGSEIPLDILDEIRATTEKVTVIFPWEKGDLLALDNVLFSHGRNTFSGPRKILVAMKSL